MPTTQYLRCPNDGCKQTLKPGDVLMLLVAGTPDRSPAYLLGCPACRIVLGAVTGSPPERR